MSVARGGSFQVTAAEEEHTRLLEQLNDAMADDTTAEAAAAAAEAAEAKAEADKVKAELRETQSKAKHALHTKTTQLKAEADKAVKAATEAATLAQVRRQRGAPWFICGPIQFTW